MVIPQIAILSLLITQTLSAPTGCTELCSSSFKEYLTSGNFQDHASQSATLLQGPDYSRPGTWSEHNDYNVDNGHGKVHEERGQYVAGPKTVRYYRKNYASSYSTRHSNDEGLSDIGHENNNYRHSVPVPNTDGLSSQRMYDQIGNSESITQQHKYNAMQSQQHIQSSIRRSDVQSERLENFGKHVGNSQALHQGLSDTQISQVPYYTNIQPGNWSKVDSYKTDGGHGRVFEEEGQYISGAKKVRYYKKNYTSSYSSNGGIPEPIQAAVPDLQKEIDKLHREITQTSGVHAIGSSDTASTNINAHDSATLHNINSNRYRSQNNYESSSYATHNENQQLREAANDQVPIRIPSPNSYGTNSYSLYEKQEGHISKSQPVSQIIVPTSGYTNALNTGSSGHSSSVLNTGISQQQMDNIQQVEHLDTHQLRHDQNSAINSGTLGRAAHYKEHWSASHTKEASVPQYATGISEIRDNNMQYNINQYENRHMNQALQQDSYMNQLRENSYNSAHRTQLGKLITGTLDLGQTGDTVDCAYDTQSTSQYKMKYKRGIKDDQNTDDTLIDTQQSHQPWKPGRAHQHSEDLTLETNKQDDLTQQTMGKFELGQESQQSYQPWRAGSASQHSEDLTQQTSDHDDLTQQTSGKLEFGQESQQSYQPWRPQSEDLTQQTSDHDDLTQQTSGKLEFGQESQQSYQPWGTGSASQHSEDLTQQTSDHDDLTQQTSGKLKFGQESQQSYQPWRPQSEDLTQQTSDQDDLTQQTSGKLEFGQESQQSYQPWGTGSASQHSEDLTQQTSDHDDLTQQTSGKLKFGQESQQSYQPWRPQSEDLTQQTSDQDDLTQQTSGKLEFGQESQQSHQPWRPQSEDLTQQTSDHDDLTQQTSGKLEFGQESQQSYQPWRPQSEDLTQQTSDHDDLTQQTSGKLEFGQESQQSYQPWRPQSEHLTQQTSDRDDLTQQTSGKLEFGQESQQSHQPWRPQLEDLTQQTNDQDDLTQQTSGKLEFGQQSEQSHQPWRSQSEDLTQQTSQQDDLAQQTSGKLEFGLESQQSHQPWRSQSEDLTQQTSDHDDFTQQTSGKLEFSQESQQSYQPWRPQSEDLTQQAGNHDDFTQQTSGKLEFGQESQQSYQPWRPASTNQQVRDLTQQTGEVVDLTQQTSGKREFGQSLQTDTYAMEQESTSHIPKPAIKPKPRSRYARVGSVGNVQIQNQNMYDTNTQKPIYLNTEDTSIPSIYEIPPYVESENDKDNIRSQDIRGDQFAQNSNRNNSKDSNQPTVINSYNIEGDNVDQVNWLHKSNDATVGLQWHYTYHPSDHRQFVQQTDQKDKENLQQQTSQIKFSDLQQTTNQQDIQDKYLFNDNQDNQDNQASQLYLHSRNYAFGEAAKSDEGTVNQETDNEQKYIRSSENLHQLEPRILEAYGGGPYDVSHSDDIYHGITINPSATLSPINGADPWDIREKPEETTPPPMPVEPLDPIDVTTPSPSFWSKLGYKITNSFDKAKEKLEIFLDKYVTITHC
ncbi:uncharacterized protein LOC114873608 [Osmia bicornis bicornis]|uniref:uncharacterized protein LOC114873608 n=1 Tax=Osmia bicornis bicornis TaxID=1437191 RepID=UPI001EAE8471|nr:uncharacterized protein LOC114873608 [Osmia bicornis bicornis]